MRHLIINAAYVHVMRHFFILRDTSVTLSVISLVAHSYIKLVDANTMYCSNVLIYLYYFIRFNLGKYLSHHNEYRPSEKVMASIDEEKPRTSISRLATFYSLGCMDLSLC